MSSCGQWCFAPVVYLANPTRHSARPVSPCRLASDHRAFCLPVLGRDGPTGPQSWDALPRARPKLQLPSCIPPNLWQQTRGRPFCVPCTLPRFQCIRLVPVSWQTEPSWPWPSNVWKCEATDETTHDGDYCWLWSVGYGHCDYSNSSGIASTSQSIPNYVPNLVSETMWHRRDEDAVVDCCCRAAAPHEYPGMILSDWISSCRVMTQGGSNCYWY